MKKIIIFSAALLCLASCSKDNEDIKTNAKVPAIIQAETDIAEKTTRAVWGTPSNGTISVMFNGNDNFDLFEYINEKTEGPTTFTKIDQRADQSAKFQGTWSGQEKTEWAAILPSNPTSNKVTMSKANNELTNTYEFVIPAAQTASITNYWESQGVDGEVEKTSLSPDRMANFMLASKTSEKTYSGFFAPVCAYLYFATQGTAYTAVKIVASDKEKDGDVYQDNLAGKVTMTTTGQWDSWANFEKIGKAAQTAGNVSISDGVNYIIATSQPMTRTKGTYNEFIVCVLPGTHTFTITTADGTTRTFGTTDPMTMYAANVYYLGQID